MMAGSGPWAWLTGSWPASAWQLGLAYLLDLSVGDPPWFTHPVVLIGRLITWLEGRLYGRWPSIGGRAAGAALVAIVVVTAYGVTCLVVQAASWIQPWLGYALSVGLLSTALAGRSLGEAALAVYRPLTASSEGPGLAEARRNLSCIVGRDTAALSPQEVARAAVETVAENTSDGFVAPLLYGLLGGAPLAMAYKAVNTLDSMLGYRNDRYRDFGWASARLDDLANLFPARLTGLLMAVAAWLLPGHSGRQAWRVLRRDARRHPSPNSGFPEAAMAGALGVRLGGLNHYDGVASQRPVIGAGSRATEPADILRAVRLLQATCALAAGLALALGLAWRA